VCLKLPRYIEELVAQQVHRSELAQRREIEPGKPCPTSVITISRRMGSGARIVAAKLAQELGWSIWDKELIEAVAQDARVSRHIVEAFDEKAVSEIEAFAHSVLGNYEMGSFMYLRHLARAIVSIAKLGNAIILGRGANFILPDALNVRIDAPDEKRIENMMKYEQLTREEAEKKIRQSDRERQEFLERTFGRERVKSVNYDLTIWMEKFDTDGAVRIIKTALDVWCPLA
jgi:cytidylate kinase